MSSRGPSDSVTGVRLVEWFSELKIKDFILFCRVVGSLEQVLGRISARQ